jgi:hypothetical protein
MVRPHGTQTVRGGSSGFFEVIARVNTTTSNYVVLAEFGRFPLEIFWWEQTMRFLSRVTSEVDSDRMLRLTYDVQLQLLATRRKVLLENQSAVGRKSRLPACWLAQVDEQLSMYNLCINSYQLPPCAHLKQLAERQYIVHHQVAAVDSNREKAYLGLNSSAQYGYKEYLSRVDNAQLRRSLACFHCANHKL